MRRIHVVSHTHWDREWYLTFQQFRLKLVHLIDNLLDLLEDDPAFKHFMLDGQTIVLDDYLQMRPEKEDLLRKHIQAGRIQIGPWHILPDMFLVSPEAHIRNLLEGARRAKRFGARMPIGYIPDAFGHPGQVPQMLCGFGMETAVLWRGVSDMPAEMWWEAPDGSRVLLAYLRDSYSNGANLPAGDDTAFAERISLAADSLAAHSAVSDQLIMFGTDHMAPPAHTGAAIVHADQALVDAQVLHSTLPDYVERIGAQIAKRPGTLPVIRGELRACDRSPLLPGVLSTRIWIKQHNQQSQTLLEKWAEPFSVFSERMFERRVGRTAEKRGGRAGSGAGRLREVAPIIRHAWRLLMENHPHDSICGCSIDQVHDEMKPRFDQVDQIGEEITFQALQSISEKIDTRCDDAITAMVLFNPSHHPRRDLVEMALNLPQEVGSFEIINADQQIVGHEFARASNAQYANLVLGKESLREAIGYIHEGRVAGAAITSVKVTRQDGLVIIEAVLDETGKPNIQEWQQAERQIARFEADPTVTQFHVIAHSPRTSVVRFVSPEIPPMGWAVLWARACEAPPAASAAGLRSWLRPLLPLAMRFAQSEIGEKLLGKLQRGDETRPPFIIENEFFAVEASKTDGTLRVTDKRNGAVFSGLNRFYDGGDAGDEYNYSPPVEDSLHAPRVRSLKVFRQAVAPSLEIDLVLKIPAQISADRRSRSGQMIDLPIRTQVSLVPRVARIDIQTEVDNCARDHRLRVHFPAPIAVDAADHDGHFEVVRRAVGAAQKGDDWVEDPRPEVPQGAFTNISHGKIGLMVANRGLPEVEVVPADRGSEIALTLLRCVGWLSRDDLPVRQGHAGPGFETPGAQLPGKWTFDYALIPHAGDWRQACLPAFGFQSALRGMEAEVHPGELPHQGSFLCHSPQEFVISAVKVAESGAGMLVRGYNISDDPIQLHLKPHGCFAGARLVNLAEEDLAPLVLRDDGSIVHAVRAFEIVSILFSDQA